MNTKNLEEMIQMFKEINVDCVYHGDDSVPLTADNLNYYEQQMENLEMDEKSINSFSNWLRTQK